MTSWAAALSILFLSAGGAAADAVSFNVKINGFDGQIYKFHLLGSDMATFHNEPGETGKTIRFSATREQMDQTTGYCVVLPVNAVMSFKDDADNRSKSVCKPLKGETVGSGTVISLERTLYR